MRLVLATRNPHKVRELEALLAPHEVLPLPDDVELPPETGDTFAGNALIKAQRGRAAPRACRRSPTTPASRRPRSAARPGCARRATPASGRRDEENLAKLLARGAGRRRSARALRLRPRLRRRAGGEHLFEGVCDGTLAHDPRGSGGFGYDPAFVPDDRDDGLTMAELPPEEKDAISHRGRAARAFRDWLARENAAA